MLNNVKDFGASGDGNTDDRPAIQRAINDAAADATKAGIFFPAGTYRVSRVGVPGAGGCSLDLNGVQDFMIMGEGPKSVVQLEDTTERTGDWHVFLLRNDCKRVVFKDLVIDGNSAGLTNPDEQSHGIEVDSGTADLVVDRCILRNCFGDGLRMLRRNAPQRKVRRLRIENCLFRKNKRSGVAIQRGVEQIIIANCVFAANVSDNSIDIESTSTNGPTDVVIQGCIINHTNGTKAVSLVGRSDGDPLVRCKFSNNIVLGGPISCVSVNQLTIQNNIVQVPERGFGKRIPLDVNGGVSVMISGNLLVDDTGAEAVIRLVEINSQPVTHALVANNLCIARSGSGISCEGSDDFAIQGNMIVAKDSCTRGIFLRAAQSSMDNISIRDNDITVKGTGKWTVGVHIAANPTAVNPRRIGHISVIGNSIRGATEGVKFENPFQRTPVCALNRIAADVPIPFVGLQFLPEKSVVVGGATSRGGTIPRSGAGRFIAGLGDPNTNVTGNVGDIFQRLDGGLGEAFYVKETGDDTAIGWTAK